MKNSRVSRKPNLGMFHISCWIIGLVAFVQLMSVGAALAFRNQQISQPKERIVKEYVVVPGPPSAVVTAGDEKPEPITAVSYTHLTLPTRTLV